MAKTTGPLMSLDASGSVAGTIVFSKWKGRNYVRQLVTPANPQTGPQTGVRAMMKFLSQAWGNGVNQYASSYQAYADSLKVSTFNAFVKYNLMRTSVGQYPTQSYQQAPAAYTSTAVGSTATGGVKSVTLATTLTDTAGNSWGALIYRSNTTGFTPAPSNLIAINDQGGATPSSYFDSPLGAGTWYYQIIPMSEDGQIGTSSGELSATVTP